MALAMEAYTIDLRMQWQNAKIIRSVRKKIQACIAETLEILKR